MRLFALAAGCLAACGGPDGGDTPTRPVVGPPAAASTFAREVRGGQLHQGAAAALAGARPMDAANLLPAVKGQLAHALGSLGPSDFVLSDSRKLAPAVRNGAELTYTSYRQQLGGVPIWGSYLNLTLHEDGHGSAKLVASSFHLYQDPRALVTPSLDAHQAERIARAHLRTRSDQAVVRNQLELRPIEGNLQLVYDILVQGKSRRALVLAAGPKAGSAIVLDDRVYEGTGTVSGVYAAGGAPGAAGTPTTAGLPSINVTGGGTTAQADATGHFVIGVPAGTPITATLSGRSSTVSNQAGPPLSASGVAGNGVSLVLDNAGADEHTLAQVNVYEFIDRTRSFLEQNGLSPEELGGPIPANVNILDQQCNAFYDFQSVNFFSSGGGCHNSAIDSVIAHEYGHFVDDHFGGINDGGLSEGWGDTLACLSLQQAIVGEDFTDDGGLVRSCDNNYVYPPGGADEVHSLGQAWSGFVWHARAGLVASLGEEQGDALARALVLPSFQSNSPDIPTSVREVFLRDDDDGDLTNHTPHWDILYAAALQHGLTFAVETDLTAPAPITDLTLAQVNATSATIAWTAPGDDGTTGIAAAYDLRWSTLPITDAASFAAAAPLPAPTPIAGGLPQVAIIPVPPGTTIHVAMVARDEQNNTSPLSNDLTIAVPEGVAIFSDGAETGIGQWTADGLWHITQKHASEGTHSFWYGQESTGNYDTGTTNSGTLKSPIIDLSAAHDPVLAVDQWIDVEGGLPFDNLTITVTDLDDASKNTTFEKTTGSTGGAFVPRVESLAAFTGHHIQLAFFFDSVDDVFNDTEGWFVDHVRVIGSDGTTCDHPKCQQGGPLAPDCDTCVAAICAVDPFCCQGAWDGICQGEVGSVCGETCPVCGNGTCDAGEDCTTCAADCGTCGPTCEHPLCDPGAPLTSSCDSCTANVCATDPYCCTTEWDRICVTEAESTCGLTCTNTCAHPLCENGGPLDATCDACVATVCADDDYCCKNSWDRTCINEAVDKCALDCVECAHDMCAAGGQLDPTCDTCAAQVCAEDPYCCNNEWDSRCVDKATQSCGLACGCSHPVCDAGGALAATCDPCVTQVCAADPYCCDNAWDDRCIEESNSTCGLACAVSPNPVRRLRR